MTSIAKNMLHDWVQGRRSSSKHGLFCEWRAPAVRTRTRKSLVGVLSRPKLRGAPTSNLRLTTIPHQDQ